MNLFDKMTKEAQLAYELMNKPISQESNWVRQLWNFNLPDAHDGYAILLYEQGRFS